MKIRSLILGLTGLVLAGTASAAGGQKHAHAPEEGWPFEGITGHFEEDSVQRGYQVYQEVCASCHGMKLLSYRNLGQKGGPFYDPAYPNPNDNPLVKAFAAENIITDPVPDADGDLVERPARPADRFKEPYQNEALARKANGGALPPDLSVITKARHNGPSYVYSLLLGYPDEAALSTVEASPAIETAPASDGGTPDDPSDDTEAQFTPAVMETRIDMSKLHKGDHGDDHGDDHHDAGYLIQAPGQYYNPYMAGDTTPQFVGDPRHPPEGGFLAMPPQLQPRVGLFEYMDGTEATAEQMAYDVSQFLTWAGEPKMITRKRTGIAAIAYLFILAILLWFSYKRIWRNVEH